MISLLIINPPTMSNLHFAPRTQKPRPATSRRRPPQIAATPSRHAELIQARHAVALDMILHILHAHLQVTSAADEERIIHW